MSAPGRTDLPGRTHLPVEVISKIAGQAALEARGIGAGAGGFLGMGSKGNFGARPQAKAEVFGRAVVLRLELGVRFGEPIESTLSAARTHITERVETLTGLSVRQVDVSITWVHQDREDHKKNSHKGKELR
ncbi:Asp23/Gls24 family envelope stress response protein [Galactobacter caseinivorans]|uniref:Asp23/Gls24 family envelope stress response protein n=1 Tax=Galactobacter caseinivorans TaxID=2676123 RepID=A0A496PHF8_9MICC|nr:Asp23/Gls24 family envelope stress response protein [Galactobacter caseinivorans]RKW69923.1 Asp23/Gls24 family envelope stress response protein [Galactobacter caseinivorans]